MITRRALLGGSLAVAGTALSGCALRSEDSAAGLLVFAAGESGGLYVEFANLFARELHRDLARARVDVVITEGSRDNLDRLVRRQADLGLVLADTADAAHRAGRIGQVRAIAKVYENYLQVVVLDSSPVTDVGGLRGRRVALGAVGSGAALTGDLVLRCAGLEPERDVKVTHPALVESIRALEAGEVDALVWSGGVPTPALAQLHLRRPIRLLPLGQLVYAMRSRGGPFYHAAAVPPGSYGLPRDASTVGVPNLLLCRVDLPTAIVRRCVLLLVGRAASLVPDQARGAQYLEKPDMIHTGAIPLHPGASAAYREVHG